MKSPLRKIYFRWQSRFVSGLRNPRGMGLVEILMVAAMMGGSALVGTKVMNDFAERQNHANMRDIRQRLFQEYYEIARNKLAIENSLAVNNADIVSHVNGVSSPAIGTRRCMELRNQVRTAANPNGVVVLADVALATQVDNLPAPPATPNYCNLGGSYFDEKGGKNCRGGPCSAANARFHVYIVWIPVAPKKYDTDVVVRILNVPTKQGMLAGYDEISGKSITASQVAADVWSTDVSPNRIWRDAGGGAYTGYFGLGTSTPQARLEVIGDFMVTSGTASNRGNLFYLNRDSDVGINLTNPAVDGMRPGIEVNGSAYIGPRIFMDRDGANNSWIGHKGTLGEGQRVGLGFRSTPGTGIIEAIRIQVANVLRIYFNNNELDIRNSANVNFFDAGNMRYGRIIKSGNGSGNFHFDSIGGGQTFFNWYGGAGKNTYVGNGATTWGPVHYGTRQAMSDRKLKKDIATIENPLEKIRALRPVRYSLIADNKPNLGFIAQDMQEVLPELVSTAKDPEKGDYLALNYSGISAVLVEGMKLLQKSLYSVSLNHNSQIKKNQQLIHKINSLERLNQTAKAKLCTRYPEEALCR